MVITVNELLYAPFSNRSREEKGRIVSEGKPRPFLQKLHSVDNLPPSTLQQDTKNQVNKYVIFFDVSSYDHVEWMTGCDIRQALYCWPCLLYRVQKDSWNTTGITDLSHLQEKIKVHEKSISHIQGMLDLQLFSQDIVFQKPPVSTNEPDKELIKRNREIVKRVIDVICFLVTQQQPPRIGTSDKNLLEIEDCLENLQFLREYDILHASLIDDTTDMLQISPKFIMDMVDSITSVVKMSIQKETCQSSYVSMILSEHSEEHTKSQFSTVLRYLKGSEVCERFLGFTNTEGRKSPSFIFDHINKVITEFQISRRIIAFSLDGSVLHSATALGELRKELKFRHPFTYFVPCHFHKLDHILLQSLSYSQECSYFFKIWKEFGFFFHKDSKILQDFQRFKVGEVPNLDILNSTSHLEFFNTVKIFRRCFIDFFDYMINNSSNATSDDLIKMYAFRTFLTNQKTIFFIEAFIKIFNLISPLREALNYHTPHKAFDSDLFDGILQAFQKEVEYSTSTFENLWRQVISELDEVTEPELGVSAGNIRSNKKYACHKIYLDVVKCISNQIKCRFESSKKLVFFNILNFEECRKHLKLEYVQNLTSAYGQCFNYTQICKEIEVLLANEESVNTESVHQLLKCFISTGLCHSFENLHKISELVLTMPCTSPSVRSCSSKLQEIKIWCYSAGKNEIPGDLSLLCIEKDYLEELKQKVSFYDEVILKFQDSNKSMELLYS